MTVKLRPFQAQDLELLENKFHGRCLVGWSPGLGKTLLSLSYIQKYLGGGPVVVVCPATAKETWKRQAMDHCGIRVTVLGGLVPKVTSLSKGKTAFYVINYDVLGRRKSKKTTWLDLLKQVKPRLVVIDEAHMLRNHTTARSRSVRSLCAGVKKVLALTGTPVINRPMELWVVLNILRPDLFPPNSRMAFGLKFCAGKKTPWGWDFRGSSNLDKLNKTLHRSCFIRRLRADVLKELPPETRVVVPVSLSKEAAAEYAEAEHGYVDWLTRQLRKKGKDQESTLRALRAHRMTRLNNLKILIGGLKLDFVERWVRDFLESTPDKLLLFGVHRSFLGHLHERFRSESVLVTGAVTGRPRQAAFDRFNLDPECRLFLGNIDAAGTAWSCTSASCVAFPELAWTPGQHDQAKDRVQGIARGLRGRGAVVYWLLADGTVDTDLLKIMDRKQKVIDRAVDGKMSTGWKPIMDQLEESILRRVKECEKDYQSASRRRIVRRSASCTSEESLPSSRRTSKGSVGTGKRT